MLGEVILDVQGRQRRRAAEWSTVALTFLSVSEAPRLKSDILHPTNDV